jgi:hypothetical protein
MAPRRYVLHSRLRRRLPIVSALILPLLASIPMTAWGEPPSATELAKETQNPVANLISVGCRKKKPPFQYVR